MNATHTRILAAVALLAVGMAGCGGAGAGGSSQPGIMPAAWQSPAQLQSRPLTPYTGPRQLADFSWGANIAKRARYVGPAKDVSLSVDVQLRGQNAAGLLQYAKAASDPASPLYRRFLTPQEIGRRFGASESSVHTAERYFMGYHLGVGTWPQGLMMVVAGKQSDMEAAFGTKFGVYREYGKTFVAPMQQPHFSRVLPIAAVSNLVHVQLRHTFLIRGSNGQFFGMSGPQIRRAFDFTGPAAAGLDGKGINVGIIGTGPIWKNDVPTVGRMFREKVANVVLSPVVAHTPSPQNNGTGTGKYDPLPDGLQTPPPTTKNNPGCYAGLVSKGCNIEDGEAQLDTEQVAQLAPGSTVEFYLAYNTHDCDPAYGNPYGCPPGSLGILGIYLTDDEIQQAISDNTADAVSMSFGGPEPDSCSFYCPRGGPPDSQIGPLEMAALVSEGIAVFASSGDNGAHQCYDYNTGGPTAEYCASYPATDPSVVAVGGVNYPMDNAGNLPPTAEITAWAENTTLGGDGYADNSPGSGGGVSQFFTQPTFQSVVRNPKVPLHGMRGVPDVSMLADPLTGPLLLMYGHFPGQQVFYFASGGTSASAPEMAAAWAVVLQNCKQTPSCSTASGAHPWRLGNPNPYFYSLYSKPGVYHQHFYDVLAGSNGAQSVGCQCLYPGYNAGKGYDLVTGLGVPFVGHLLTNGPPPGSVVQPSSR